MRDTLSGHAHALYEFEHMSALCVYCCLRLGVTPHDVCPSHGHEST